MNRSRVVPAAFVAGLALLLALCQPFQPSAEAGSGRGRIYSATALGGSPASYRVVVDGTASVTVGDHLFASVAGGLSGLWAVTAKTATTIDVREDLTEQQGGVFGPPVPGSFAFSTPNANGTTPVPDGAVGWAAAYRRNDFLTVTGGGASSLTAAIDAAFGSTRGAVLVRGASGWTILPPGASGRAIVSNGAGADPTYQVVSPTAAALTKSDDTNVTLALGGTPSTALLQATSLTLGWTGTLAASRGGTGAASLTAGIDAAFGSTRGSILYRGASGWAILAPGTSGHALVSNGAGADPSYTAVTTPTPGWDDVLAVDATSGANSPSINSGQALTFAAATASQGVRFTRPASNTLTFLGGDGSTQTTTVAAGDGVSSGDSGAQLTLQGGIGKHTGGITGYCGRILLGGSAGTTVGGNVTVQGGQGGRNSSFVTQDAGGLFLVGGQDLAGGARAEVRVRGNSGAGAQGAVEVVCGLFSVAATAGVSITGAEIADPAAPAADRGTLYFRDNGSGKSQLVVVFSTGAVQVIATEP